MEILKLLRKIIISRKNINDCHKLKYYLNPIITNLKTKRFKRAQKTQKP